MLPDEPSAIFLSLEAVDSGIRQHIVIMQDTSLLIWEEATACICPYGILVSILGVKVNASIRLSTDHADTLDDLRDELAEKRKRFEKLLSTLGSKSLWVKIVFAILASAVSFGISHLIFVTSKYNWAHRAYIAAVAANRENPGEEYAKAWIGFQEEGRKYKSTVKVLETTAKMVKNLESILADYIEEEFEVREYDLRIKTEQQCIVVCYHPSKDEKISYRIHTTPDGMVTRVEKEIRKKAKGKSSQTTEWVEIDRKAN